MSGGGLSKLGTALAIIFAVSVAALFAELFYVLWRRRVFRRHSCGGGDDVSAYSSSESTFPSVATSKELLYFFCIRSQSRLDQSSIASNTATNDRNSAEQSDMEVIDIDLLTIQGMFGPPRFLFTIKEEEREDMESPAEKYTCEKEVKKKKKINDDDDDRRKVSLEECFNAVEDQSVVAVEIAVDDATPFSTPCGSPVFFTPSSSPVHEVVNVPLPEYRTAPAVATSVAL